MSLDKGRLQWLDAIKALAIVFIVLGHALNGYGPVWHWVYGFHVPLFIAISGFTFRVMDCRFLIYAGRKARAILLPYCIWGAISIMIYAVVGSAFDGERALSLQESVFGLIWANGETGIMRWNLPMWYLPTFFVIQVIAFFFDRSENRMRTKVVLAISSAVFAAIVYRIKWVGNLPFGIETAVFLLPFFFFGQILRLSAARMSQIKLSTAVIIGILGSAVATILILCQKNVDYVSDQYRIYPVFLLAAMTMIASIFILFIQMKKVPAVICKIGQSTLAIMIMQRFPLIFFEKVCPGTKQLYTAHRGIASFLITLLTIILCVVAADLIGKWFPWMLGKIRAKS